MCRKYPKCSKIANILGLIHKDNSDFGVKPTYETVIKFEWDHLYVVCFYDKVRRLT
jgi:hypothetical protein